MKRPRITSRKTVVDGITFASAREARRFSELKLLERGGAISDLKTQVRFELVPAVRLSTGKMQRATHYIADFTYTDEDTGLPVVEDCKGFRTEMYRLKRKLMKLGYDVEILET